MANIEEYDDDQTLEARKKCDYIFLTEKKWENLRIRMRKYMKPGEIQGIIIDIPITMKTGYIVCRKRWMSSCQPLVSGETAGMTITGIWLQA